MADQRTLDLMSLAASYTIIEDAIQNLDSVTLADEEIAALLALEPDHKMRLIARLVELDDVLREESRALSGRVLQLTSEEGS